MITQTFFYFSSYRKDPSWIKAYVAVLLLNDTLNTVFNTWWIYDVLINNFGNVEALGKGNWLFETEEAMAGIIAMQVQFFYAWRIKTLTRSWWPAILVIVPSVVGGPAETDGVPRTNQMLSRLVQLIMSNGLLTASLALADIISYLATTKGYHIGFNYALVKLYGNSVMSSLNARKIITDGSSKESPYSEHDSSGRQTDIQLVSTGTRGRLPQAVVVSVERHEVTDVAVPTFKHGVDWSDDVHHDIKGDFKNDVV
ncbi:uncharacterized protein B0H18DRAFT_1117680 [Fomitopsis serialis]|uniref:uncharacterized protein n=1 Tax=Fomitopsis serialis TaxID=139415 RepID=UPI002008EAB9|nr:uncharacterized protein B0H18DRAFT_1117680 [Neoantrodia serialis]KAH9928854.1 hypothetical protein B0H18DRAFT_1117680 [Neoantrodia serialis]